MTIAPVDRELAHFAHEVGPEDAIHLSEALPMSHPGHRHSVRCIDDSAVQNAAKLTIGLGFHHSMDPGETDITGSSRRHPSIGQFDRALQIERGYHHSQHIGVFMGEAVTTDRESSITVAV